MVRKVLFLAVILAMLVSAMLPQVAMAQTIIRDIGDANGFWYPSSRESVYVKGRQWVLFEEGGFGYYSSSPDNGATWSSPTSIGAAVYGWELALATDGTNIAYTRGVMSTTTLYFRMGTANSDGTITWLAAEQTVFSSTYLARFCSLVFDSNGYPWVGTTQNNNADAISIKSFTKDGTWTTEEGFPKTISSSANFYTTILLPATSGKMIALCGRTVADKLYATRYDGVNWGTTKASTSTLELGSGYWSATIQDDDAKIVFLEDVSYDIVYTEFLYSTNSFSAETTLYSGATSTSAPVIQLNTEDNNLTVYWENDPVDNHIYWMSYHSSDSTWYGEYDWIAESDGLPAAGYYLNCDLTATTNTGGLYYIAGTAILKWKLLTLPWAVETLDPTGVTSSQATIRGEITGIGSGTIAWRGIAFGTDPTLTSYEPYGDIGTFGAGVYSYTVTGLESDTIYYYKAQVEDSYGNSTEGNITVFMTLQPGYADEGEIPDDGLIPPLPEKPGGWIRPPKDWGDWQGIPWTFIFFLFLVGFVVLIGLGITKTTRSVGVLIIVLGFIIGLFSFWPKGGYLDWWILFPYIIVGWALMKREKESPIT